MSEIFSVQVTAAATVALAALALLTAVLAYLAWRKQSKEVSDQAAMLRLQSEQLEEQRKINARQTEVLELQAAELRDSLEERKREAGQRRAAQASRVFISLEPDGERSARFEVVNTSGQPVYGAELQWNYATVPIQAVGHVHLGTILPGDRRPVEWHPPQGDPLPRARPDDRDAVLTFRDTAGITWMRKLNGDLTEASRDGKARPTT